jgi:hypothetical protein
LYRIRRARPSDNEALIALERRVHVDLGPVALTFDRSPDFFAQHRLQEHPLVLVAEEAGKPVALMAGSWHDTRLGGRERRLLYIHKARVPAERHGSGLGAVLALELGKRGLRWGVENGYWFIGPGNTRATAFARKGGLASIVATAGLLHFDTIPETGKATRLRPVTPIEVKAVVGLLNGTHEGQELFQPYTLGSLNRRLSRSPEYAWGHVFAVDEGGELAAVVGLWDQGRSLRVTSFDKATGQTHTVSQAVVADYGFRPGAEGALAALLRQAGAVAASWGRQEVMMTVPAASPLLDLLADLRPRLDTLCFFVTGDVRKSVGPELWVDPVYL